MKILRPALVLAFLIAGTLTAQDAKVTPPIRFTGTTRMRSFTCWKAQL